MFTGIITDVGKILSIDTGNRKFKILTSFGHNKIDKSFILNSGNDQLYDSTLVTVTYEDDLISLADFSGNLIIGKNPNSAVSSGNVTVLCSYAFRRCYEVRKNVRM